MQLLNEIFVTIIIAYLAFTNFLADKIETLFFQKETSSLTENTSRNHHILPSLPAVFNSNLIPDILLRSSEYQSASVISASTNHTITDPLAALVNIYCTFITPTTIRTTTGTGFFVHSDGVILTNAHVAQYLLLEKTKLLGDAECLIRTGNPAKAEYIADLLYISPAWIQKNAPLIDSPAPTGTGERDYALLYVKKSATNSPLPARFPALAVDTNLLPISMRDNDVVATGYPATNLIRTGNPSLTPEIATTSISELYTFGSNYADVFSIRGSSVGAEGSSGGPIVNANGKVIGMIVTRGDDQRDGQGSLRAITLSHIHRTIEEETGFSLERNFSGNIEYRSIIFSQTLVPFLIQLLSLELSN